MSLFTRLLGSPARIAVLELLANSNGPLTGRAIWQAVRVLPGGPQGLRTVQLALHDLIKEGMVRVERPSYSRAHLHRLDFEHPVVRRIVLPLVYLSRADEVSFADLISDWITPDFERMGLYSATLADTSEMSQEVCVVFMVQSGYSAADKSEEWLARTVDLIARESGRQGRVERVTFQSIRERAQTDAWFRTAVVERGEHLCGARLASLADPARL